MSQFQSGISVAVPGGISVIVSRRSHVVFLLQVHAGISVLVPRRSKAVFLLQVRAVFLLQVQAVFCLSSKAFQSGILLRQGGIFQGDPTWYFCCRSKTFQYVISVADPGGIPFLGPRHVLFVCVEVLRPSQPNWVMSSVVSLPNHTFTGQA